MLSARALGGATLTAVAACFVYYSFNESDADDEDLESFLAGRQQLQQDDASATNRPPVQQTGFDARFFDNQASFNRFLSEPSQKFVARDDQAVRSSSASNFA